MATQNNRSMLSNKHLNRGLFSDHYLDEIVPTSSEWSSDTLSADIKLMRDEITLIEEATKYPYGAV